MEIPLFKFNQSSINHHLVRRSETMKITVFGTGAYGMALATVLKRNHHQVLMWTNFPEERDLLVKERKNEERLKGIHLDDEIEITCDIEEACRKKDLLVMAVPVAYLEETIQKMQDFYERESSVCIASKGLEIENGLFAHEIVEKYLNTDQIAVMSGPTFAIDLANDTVCALTVASNDLKTAARVDLAFHNEHLKLERWEDILGVELCGGMKNIMAIATGILNGLGQSESTKAFFQKRALQEMATIIEALGGNENTIFTYAGMGDLILTCNSLKSRNYTYGSLIGMKSKERKEYEENTTIEGLYTLQSIYSLLQRKKIASSLMDAIYDICIQKEDPTILLEVLVEK